MALYLLQRLVTAVVSGDVVLKDWRTAETLKADSRRQAMAIWYPNGRTMPGHFRIRKAEGNA
jgi:hypothetical protein